MFRYFNVKITRAIFRPSYFQLISQSIGKNKHRPKNLKFIFDFIWKPTYPMWEILYVITYVVK
jgi:hypothetical protein